MLLLILRYSRHTLTSSLFTDSVYKQYISNKKSFQLVLRHRKRDGTILRQLLRFNVNKGQLLIILINTQITRSSLIHQSPNNLWLLPVVLKVFTISVRLYPPSPSLKSCVLFWDIFREDQYLMAMFYKATHSATINDVPTIFIVIAQSSRMSTLLLKSSLSNILGCIVKSCYIKSGSSCLRLLERNLTNDLHLIHLLQI